MPNEKNLNTIPVGTLGLIPLESCASLGQKVNQYLTEWRAERSHAQSTALHFSEYSKDSYIVKAKIRASVLVKQRALLKNQSAAAICILWWMFVTIAKRIRCADM